MQPRVLRRLRSHTASSAAVAEPVGVFATTAAAAAAEEEGEEEKESLVPRPHM